MGKLKKRLLFQFVFNFSIFFFSTPICFSQPTINDNDESLFKVSNTVIKKEVAYFSITGTSKKYFDSLSNTTLKNIRFKLCTTNAITFEQGSIVSTDKVIRIITEKFDTTKHKLTFSDNPDKLLSKIDNMSFWGTSGTIPQKKVAGIKYSLHNYYFSVFFPDNAFDGLYEPKLCFEGLSNDKKKSITNCKVLESEDRKRLYIYMLNGEGKNRYEVTWIIENQKYLMRVIDKVPE